MHQLARVLMALALIATITTANNASDAPVAWWRFDEGKGDTVHDASGRGHDGKVIGARWVDGKFGKALYFDGNARVVIPDAKDLRLRGPISVEAWIKPDDISTWRMIVRKELEYQLRISPPQEGNNTAFFVFLSGRWEHRVNNAIPEVGKWHHIVGVWTGERLVLWFNGEPMSIWRRGTPKWTSNPVLIGSGFVGAIDDVRIYQRPLTWDEVLAHYRGEEVSVMRRTQLTKFTFAKGIQGWRAMKCLTRLEVRNGQLTMTTLASDPLLLSPPLEIDTKVSEFMSIRMSVDGGRTGAVLFSTDAGFERIPFELRPDGRMHTYNIDLAASTQWEGKLMRIGIVPSDAPNVHVRIESIAFVEQPSGAPDVVVERCHLERPINRAGRPAKLIAVVRNFGGVAKNVRIALDLPNGIELLRGERIQGCSALKFDDEFTAEWLVRATRPMHAMVQLHVSADGVETVTYPATLTFAKSLNLPRASYVPKPKPVRGPFEVGVKYYPGWKGASRWGRIMPYPERMPLLGWYREGDPEVADWQIKWAVEHGITFFFYDWYWVRGYRHHEHALHDGLLRARYRNYIKFAIFWANHNPPKTSSEDDLLNVVDFWLRNYFRHENYLKVDGKPVVGIFTPRRFTDDMGSDAVRRAFARMRERVREAGFEGLYIIARAHGLPDELKRLEHEGYDAIWSTPHLRMGVPPYVNSAPIKMVYDLHAKHWHEVIAHRILQFVPMVWSGWDSRPWHRQRAFILRGSSPEIFKVQLERARQVLEGLTGQPRMCIIWAWNEWGEGSFIEPHRHFGFGYLDAIREVFTDAPKEHVDIVPEDVGLGPYDTPSARIQIAWEFNRNGDHEGWDASMHMRDLRVQDGCLHAVTVGNDPAFFGPPTRARASRYKFVIIRMRTTRDDIAQLYWITRFIPESEATCYRFKVIGDGRFHEYKLPVHEVRTWRGTITRLRLDPANCPNVRVSVDYIRLAER